MDAQIFMEISWILLFLAGENVRKRALISTFQKGGGGGGIQQMHTKAMRKLQLYYTKL